MVTWITPGKGFQIFVLLVASLGVGFCIRRQIDGNPQPPTSAYIVQDVAAEPADCGSSQRSPSVDRQPVSGSSTQSGSQAVDAEILRQTFNGLYREHVNNLREIDEAHYQYMMTQPDDRFLTKGLATYASVANEIPPPNLEPFRGLGFAGEVEMSTVLQHQAIFLDEMNRGEKSVDKIQLAKDLTLLELPVEAIVASLRMQANLDQKSGSPLNLAAIRDEYLAQFALAHEEEWFIISAVRKTYLNLGLPTHYDEKELRDLFPEYNRVRAEKDALAYHYLQAVKLALGL